MVLRQFRLVGSCYNGLLIKNPKNQYVKSELSESKLICEKIFGNEWFLFANRARDVYNISRALFLCQKIDKK
mgnify:CR=1 FL=1